MIIQGMILGGGGGGFTNPLLVGLTIAPTLRTNAFLALGAGGTGDTFLRSDAANIFAQRNGTTAQTFRVYGTWTDASNGDWLEFTKVAGGAATLSTAKNGTGTEGNLVLRGGAAGGSLTLQTGGNAVFSGDVYLTTTALYFGQSATNPALLPFANGITLNTFSAGTFSRLNLGGTTSSFPALKRSSATLEVRLADDSAYAAFGAAAITANLGTAIPAGGTAGAGLKVSSTANFGVFFGSGAPSLSAAKGSIYLRSDGSGIADRMYVNTDGSTTWTNFVTAA